tara:strand:- start:64 stop:1269 length:1206 start_codon:yes stop_codon:yes gene_type:complete
MSLFYVLFFFNNINMSLYDKYHSDININYMYDLVSQIIKKDTGADISTDNEFKNIFSENSKKIFTEVNSDVLEDINKVLLDNHVQQFTQLIQLKNPPLQPLDENANMNDRYNNMIQLRNVPVMQSNSNQSESIEAFNSQEPLNNGNPFMDLEKKEPIKPVEKLGVIDEESSPISELLEDIESTPTKKLPKEKINYPQYKIISSKRSNIQSSRFNYVYNLSKNNIKSSELKEVTKIVIPIEENYIFSSPIIFLQIKELDYNSSFELDHVIEDNGKKFGYYKSLEFNEINIKTDIEKLTIDIRDVSETKYDKIDIAKVNVIEIKDSQVHFICTNIEENNYLEGDYIKIINNYTKSFKVNFPLKIIKIEGNKIICPYESKHNKKITDVDMKLLNTSNQNIIYFN